mmetsp:Transcript_101349/g.321929  ORF Transcript_101349/g.321929 Transcript_101349/m.321929 type:complete len:116 (-) Transcript_101349:522-869(-)
MTKLVPAHEEPTTAMVHSIDGESDSLVPSEPVLTVIAPAMGNNGGPGSTVFKRQHGQLPPQSLGPACKQLLKAATLGAVTHSTSPGPRMPRAVVDATIGFLVGVVGLGVGRKLGG